MSLRAKPLAVVAFAPTVRDQPSAITAQTALTRMTLTQGPNEVQEVNGVPAPVTNGVNVDAAKDEILPKPRMISEIMNLYQGKKDDNGQRPWVVTYPDDLDAPAENAETARFALLVRNVKCYNGKKKLQIESIIVQSALLRDALGTVLDDYPGITTGLERMAFQPPFEPFVHRWSKLRLACENAEDLETEAHLRLLHDILQEELKDSVKAKDDLIAHNVITFDFLCMLFEPGSIIFSSKSGQPIAVHLNRGAYGQGQCGRFYNLNCHHVDWDGEKFGHGGTNLVITEFQGTMSIDQLSAFPIIFHPQESEIRQQLIQRGRRFEKLSGYHYKAYQGIAIGQGLWGPFKCLFLRFSGARPTDRPNRAVSFSFFSSSSSSSSSSFPNRPTRSR